MREREIEKWIRLRIESMGGKFMKLVSPGNNGMPDRIAVMPGGLAYFVELKTDDGRLSPIQAWQIEQLKKRDARVFVVRGMAEARAFVGILQDEQDGLL